MKQAGLKNPLGAAQMCTALVDHLSKAGLTVHVNSDMQAFDETKQRVRKLPAAPMHHYATAVFDHERAFWMHLTNATGEVVALQAYRFDEIDTHLADWCINYMIGVYMRRQEMMVPSHSAPPPGSYAEKLTGKLVYHGECWVDRSVRNRKVFELFVRLGSVLSLLKWQPDAIWGLIGTQMAGYGHHVRAGYTIVERGFLRWRWASEGIDPVEYLIAMEKHSVETMVEEHLAITDEYQPG